MGMGVGVHAHSVASPLKAFLRAQIEEKERKKREEQNLKELEDKREQERLAREQMKLREEHLKELEKARDKEV